MKILNLGAGGFIGSHLTKRLLDEGHAVTAVDLYADKIDDLLRHPRLAYIQQDIRNPAWDLDALVADADLVIDLIAYANPGLYIQIPLEVFRLNFTENLKIAEACVRHGKRLVQFSTCEVYGRTAASLKHANLVDPDDADPRHVRSKTSLSSSGTGHQAPLDLRMRQATAGARSACVWTGKGIQLYDHPAVQLHRTEDRFSDQRAGRHAARLFVFHERAARWRPR